MEQAFNKKQMKYLHDTFITKEYLDQRLEPINNTLDGINKTLNIILDRLEVIENKIKT